MVFRRLGASVPLSGGIELIVFTSKETVLEGAER
jgi:hypothetical protein